MAARPETGGSDVLIIYLSFFTIELSLNKKSDYDELEGARGILRCNK